MLFVHHRRVQPLLSRHRPPDHERLRAGPRLCAHRRLGGGAFGHLYPQSRAHLCGGVLGTCAGRAHPGGYAGAVLCACRAAALPVLRFHQDGHHHVPHRQRPVRDQRTCPPRPGRYLYVADQHRGGGGHALLRQCLAGAHRGAVRALHGAVRRQDARPHARRLQALARKDRRSQRRHRIVRVRHPRFQGVHRRRGGRRKVRPRQRRIQAGALRRLPLYGHLSGRHGLFQRPLIPHRPGGGRAVFLLR